MTTPIQDVTSLLSAWASTFKIHYAPGVVDKAKRHGKTTQMWANRRQPLEGNRMELEIKRFHNRGAQITNDLMAPQPSHKPGKYDRLRIQFDHTNPSANDFLMIQGGITKTFWDAAKMHDATFKPDYDGITRDMDELVADVGETLKKLPHLPTDGKLGTVATSGVVNDDAYVFASCSAYTSGSTHCALQLDATSIALIGQGQNIEVRTAGGVLRANNVLVTKVAPYEKVLHVQLTSTSVDGAGVGVTTCNAFAATDTIYLNGCYNQAVKGSLAQFFDPTATYFRDENGVAMDRRTPDHKQFLPHTISAGAANTDLNENHLRAVGETLAHVEADGNAVVTRMAIMARDGYNGLVKLQRDERIRLLPARESEVGRQLNVAFGFNGYVFHDPNLGSIAAVVDDFAQYGRIRFLDREDWMIVQPAGIAGDFQFLPAPIASIWFPMAEQDGTGTQSFRYSARGFSTACIACDWAENQCEITNLNTAA